MVKNRKQIYGEKDTINGQKELELCENFSLRMYPGEFDQLGLTPGLQVVGSALSQWNLILKELKLRCPCNHVIVHMVRPIAL